MSKQCQSCGMPLITKKAGDCRGTEADGTKSEKWCKLCYENGKFIDPDMTLDEMLAGVNKHWFGKRRMYKNPVLTLGSKDLEMSYDNVIEIELQQIEICGRAADYMTLSDKARMRKEPALCQYLASSAHRYLDVRASGDIFPCPCVDWHPQMRLGNIADMTLREALAAKTAKMRWARERRKANPFDPDVWMQCYRCYTD